MTNPFVACLLLSWLLFTVGLVIVLARRNILTLLLAFMIMFHATSLAWVAGVRYHGDSSGQLVVLTLLGVIAAQFLIGLGIVTGMARDQGVDISEQRSLKN